MSEIVLKISEVPQQHVGRGRAIVDPKIIEDNNWNTGQILELTYNKKTHVKLWPGSPDEYGAGIIQIDGITRQNIGAGIGDKITVKAVEAINAEQIVLSPTEKIAAEGLQEYMIYNYLNHVFTTGDTISLSTQMGSKVQFVITSTKPSKPVIVTDKTIFKLGPMTKAVDSSIPRVTYDELGGLKNEVQKIREMVELPMRHPELFEKIGVEAPKGVLLYGPPGTGKTLLAKAVAGETNAHFISLSGPEIMGKYYGESEERIREIFKQAEENSPSIVFIDEIDSIAPKRDEVSGEVEKRIVSQLLTLMDGMKSRGKVVVIAATNRPDSIDPALRRPGRFDREIEIGIPDDEGRLEILSIHTRGMPIDEKVDLKQISKTTHGFVGADLEVLSKEAAMISLRRILPEIDLDEEKISTEILQKIQITSEDFRDALKEVRPSALREVQVQVPNVSWDDVGGLEGLKEELREAVEWPIKHKEAFDYVDVQTPKGILLHGPPGTGKTLIAKALAKMTESNFISIKGPELLSKWVGESEKGVREIFRKARQAAPCIIFLDEVDALVPRRGSGGSESHVTENVVSQILTEIDGLEELHNVLIIGATNRLDIVDEALLRPGRFDRIIEVPNPDSKGREQIFNIHTKKKPLAEDVSISKLVELTEGFSGAEIAAVANRAAIAALKRYVGGKSENIKGIKVTQQDLLDAIDKVKPRKVESPMTHSIK
ncbi:MAG: CDC48 family AAA ATPase [Nitrosopumilaceae archaeon]|jgi:transitional endoplasmic reticulum ATPase|uniref:CDC48 family AAA ATPase n=3 Tax=Candidatus Nitrosomaritimum aestuariumsis TaxID=3342354 RepID=A0AC60W8S0_9ARCH|nr:CDC48 family AAA ATPase [Nitrosopumilaceae archaeon]MBA4460315.1 CDC48 family AAA ATPase [Nitrosopumilaceae archaeon]MBA4461153.1 CDC48 family AAA ATPase [Nitrosopumilaceae archaeon]MBA4463832.1 CDC48 family AAA ATPase [Nitrosopumilaceae archaeon]NCF21594.1 CDC48 family AAA ATPase [Nitrosopumilaceae archaeon]